MKSKLILYVLVLIIFTSCGVFKSNTSKTMDITSTGVIQRAVIVDLDVKEVKVTGTASSTSDQTIETIKANAVYDAVKNAQADVLIEPKFEIEQSSESKKVTVTGFPGTYKNFRPMQREDSFLLNNDLAKKVEVFNPVQEKKSNSGAVIVAVISGIASIVGLLLLL